MTAMALYLSMFRSSRGAVTLERKKTLLSTAPRIVAASFWASLHKTTGPKRYSGEPGRRPKQPCKKHQQLNSSTKNAIPFPEPRFLF
jgi:hypothetical protein